MQTLTLALFLLVNTFPFVQQPLAASKEFTSADGRFSAVMPGEPKTTQMAIETSEGILMTHITSSTDNSLNEYLVSWTEYSKASIEARGTEKNFKRMSDALVKFKGGKVLSESSISTIPYPSKTITFSTSEDKLARVTFYFVKNRVYQVMAETKGPGTDDVDQFFRSFKLLPGTPL
jgi:hypothetical protein